MRLDERVAPSGLSAFEVLIDTQGSEYNQTAPLFFSPRMWERLLGELPVTAGWHITDSDNLDTVLRYQHKQNTISVATNPTSDLLKGLQTDGGVALKLSGQKIFGSIRDFFSHRLKDGQKIKRRDLPKPVAKALADVWVDVIAWGLEQYLALRDDWDPRLQRTLEAALEETRSPYTREVLAAKSISTHRVLGSVLRDFFREPFNEYKLNLTDEEKKRIGRIKQQMIARYLQGQERVIVPHLEDFAEMGYEHASWDETLLTNYEVVRAIVYSGDEEQRKQVMSTLDREDIPYSIVNEDTEDFSTRLVNLAKTGDEAAFDRKNQEVLAQMKEGVASALTGLASGLVSGGLAGRGAGKRAARKVIGQQPVQQQIPPKPAHMPTNNTPKQQPQKSGSNFGSQFKKAASSALNTARTVVGGGDPAARQTLKSFASGEPQAQLNAQDPARAKAYVDDLLATLNSLANMRLEAPKQKPQTEQPKEAETQATQGDQQAQAESLNQINDNVQIFRQRYLEKMDTKQIISAAKQFANIVRGKSAVDLTDQELQYLQSLFSAITDKRIQKQLIQHAIAVGNTGIAKKLQKLTPQSMQVLPQVIQTLSQNRETLTQQPSQSQTIVINKNTKLSRLNGAIANALRSIDKSQQQAVINEIRLIISKYGQIEDFTVYSWADIITLVEILSEYGAPIAIGEDVAKMRNAQNISPAGEVKLQQQTQNQQTPEQQGTPQTQPTAGGEVGQIVAKVQQNPELLSKILSGKPKLTKHFAKQLGIE